MAEAFQGFPPEGIREPFKPIPITWTQRFPFGTLGENRAVPADVLEPGQAYLIQDFKTNLGDIEPSWGYTGIGAPKASPKEILHLANYKELAGTSYLVRIDEDALAYWNGTAWAIATGTMTGDENDRIRSAMVLDTLIFVNGKDNALVWEGGATFAALTADANEPDTPRHVIGFAERVVFADVGAGAARDTQRLDWSISGDATNFTDTGSGGVNLYDSQGNNPADDIMGLSVVGNSLLVVRRNSIWVGSRTGDATAPIEFYSAVRGYGALATDSIQDVGSLGIMFLGHDNVYLYNPSFAEPIPVGTPVAERILDVLDITKTARISSAYVPTTQEYYLFIPQSGDTWAKRAFVFNLERFRTEKDLVWTERVFVDEISCALGGQSAGLGATFAVKEQKLLMGDSVGDTFDSDSSDTTNDGTAFTAEFQSPQYTAGQNNLQLVRLNISYVSTATTSVTIDYSENGGNSWTTNSATSLPSSTGAVREASLWANSGVFGRNIMFRLKCTGAQAIRLVGYRVGFLQRGPIQGT